MIIIFQINAYYHHSLLTVLTSRDTRSQGILFGPEHLVIMGLDCTNFLHV